MWEELAPWNQSATGYCPSHSWLRSCHPAHQLWKKMKKRADETYTSSVYFDGANFSRDSRRLLQLSRANCQGWWDPSLVVPCAVWAVWADQKMECSVIHCHLWIDVSVISKSQRILKWLKYMELNQRWTCNKQKLCISWIWESCVPCGSLPAIPCLPLLCLEVAAVALAAFQTGSPRQARHPCGVKSLFLFSHTHNVQNALHIQMYLGYILDG
jgi:hypothetical protein